MQKVALLYNPLSGGRRARRLTEVHSSATVLQKAGILTTVAPTCAPAAIPQQVRTLIADGYDTLIACGGDGTINDVLQGMVGTSAALGVIPLGTANALAHDLGVPLSPKGAATAALMAQPKRVSVGRVDYLDIDGQRKARYFTVAVGIGVDAHLFYKLNALEKGRLGMAAYYAKAWQLWLTHRMRPFTISYTGPGAGPPTQAVVTELLAVRIRNFGGVLQELAPGASLDRDDLRLVMCRTSSRVSYLLYVARGLLGVRSQVPGVDLEYAHCLTCEYGRREGPGLPGQDPPRVYVEADGELLGTLPVEISMVPDALTLLVPGHKWGHAVRRQTAENDGPCEESPSASTLRLTWGQT